jgi:hypothetical protein
MCKCGAQVAPANPCGQGRPAEGRSAALFVRVTDQRRRSDNVTPTLVAVVCSGNDRLAEPRKLGDSRARAAPGRLLELGWGS